MFSTSASQFITLVARATSETLPSEDIAANLQVCDYLRAKKIPANQAIKPLKDRLANKNPNVQLLTLNLLEMCVKNCGPTFHVEVASKDFVDNLVSIVRFGGSSNHDVKHRILELIQAWGIAFKGRPNLNYVCDVYQSLKYEGLVFPPPRSELTDIPLGATTAPDWSDSDVCMRCRLAFTVLRRKHHCRNCGQTFCGTCCSKKMALPDFGLEEEERVCDGCYDAKMNKGSSFSGAGSGYGANPYSPSAAIPASASSYSPYSPYQPTNQSSSFSYPPSFSQQSPAKPAEDNYDAELRKALELSLQDASRSPPARSYVPPKQTVVFAPEDEDPELAAAIAASLSDVTISSNSHSSAPKSSSSAAAPSSFSFSSSSSSSSPSSSAAAKKPSPRSQSLELSETEKNSISLFSKLIYKIEQNGDSVMGNRDIQDLYSEICVLHPKLIGDLEDTDEKLRNAAAVSEKITKIVDLYNRIIEERMAYVARRTEYTPIESRSLGAPSYPAPSQYSLPPSSSPGYSAPPPSSNPSYISNPNYNPPPSPSPAPSSYQYPPSSSAPSGPLPPSSYSPVPQQQQQQQQQQQPISNPNYAAPPSMNPPSNNGPYPGFPQQNTYSYPPGQVQYPPTQNQYPPMQNQYASPASLLIDI